MSSLNFLALWERTKSSSHDSMMWCRAGENPVCKGESGRAEHKSQDPEGSFLNSACSLKLTASFVIVVSANITHDCLKG